MKASTPRLSRSREDYLKALFALGAGEGVVSGAAIARRLEVSAPSVTNMLGRLAEERLVEFLAREGARLTPAGRRAAIETVRRHRLLETFLVRVLGMDWSEAHEDAEVLEHHISDRVIEALDRLMGSPTEDPHGHPIPDRQGRIARRALVALSGLPAGTRAVVREIRDRDHARMARWKRAGLVPGAEVEVRAGEPDDDLLELSVDGRVHTAARAGVDGVFVERRAGRRTR